MIDKVLYTVVAVVFVLYLRSSKKTSDSNACVVDSRSSTPANVLSGRPPSPARSPNDLAIRNIIQEKTKIESELVQIKSQHRTVQNENTELKSKVNWWSMCTLVIWFSLKLTAFREPRKTSSNYIMILILVYYSV